MIRPSPRFPPFPYTTLFRSRGARSAGRSIPWRTPPLARGREHRIPTCPALLLLAALLRRGLLRRGLLGGGLLDRKSTRLNSSHVAISYAVFCLKKKMITTYD